MPGFIAPLLCAIAGLCVLTALQYFLFATHAWRRPAYLSFALLALSIAGFEIATLFSYEAADTARYIAATRWLADFGCLGATFAVWFAATYSEAKVGRIVWSVTAAFGLLIAANHLLPAGLILRPAGHVGAFTLPWGETISRIRDAFNPWAYAYYGAFAFVAAYCLWAGRRVRLAGRKRRGLALGLGASLMALAMASDVLMEQELWEKLYLSDYAFLPLVLIMNAALVAELVGSNDRLRRFGDASFEGIFVTRDARIVDANEQFLAMFGYARSSVTSRTAYELIAPEQRADVATWIASHPHGGRESVGLRADGTRFPIEFRPRLIASTDARTYVTAVRDITERKAVMAALEASERKYATLFHSSPDAVILTRLDVGRILEINEPFTTLFGYTRSEAIGRTTVELGLWANPRDRVQLIDRMNAAGGLRDIERSARHRDGTVRTVSMSFEPIELDGASCVVAILHDITERKQAELALRASEERFDLAVRGTTDGVWDWDLITNVVYYAPRFTALLGFTPAEFPGNLAAFTDRIHPDDNGPVWTAVRAHLETRAPYDVSFRVRHRDDTYRWFRSRAEAVWAADGKPVRMVGSLSDIHEHREAEEALRRSEAEFRAIFEGSAIGIAVIDPDGQLLVCNPALCHLLGYTSAELCARPYGEKTHADDLPRDRQLYRELFNGERAFVQDEKRYIRKDGQIVWARRTVSLVRGDDGRPRCAIGMVEDFSERKRAEESVRLAHERESQAHAEFSRRLLSAQEHERKRLATELHDSLGQQLSLIKNLTTLAHEQPGLPAPATPYLAQIAQVVTDAIGETRQLAYGLRPVHIDQFGLVNSLDGLLDQIAGSSSLQIERRLENVDDLLAGEAATHVYRLMQEALNNLLKHARASHARVALERDLRCIRLRVEDDGCGFDVAALASAKNAAGLGLTSIRERVAILGGTVAWQSAPGAGTRLRIELPLPDGADN